MRVRGHGARVRFRQSFKRFLPQEARSRTLQAAYVLPELYPDLGVEMTAVSGPSGGRGRIVDLILHLPGERLLFLPEDGTPTAHLEAGLVAIDVEAHETLRTAGRFTVALPPDLRDGPRPGLDFVLRSRLPASLQTVTGVIADTSRKSTSHEVGERGLATSDQDAFHAASMPLRLPEGERCGK